MPCLPVRDNINPVSEANFKSVWQFYKETTLSIFVPGRSAVKHDILYANSFFLIATSAANAVLGFGFWAVAARLYSAEAVGLISALLSAGGFLAFAANLGLGQGLIRYLSSARSGVSKLINSCFTLAGVVSVAAGLIFLAGIRVWSPNLDFVRGDIRYSMTFMVFLVSTTLFSLFSDTYLAFRRADFTFFQAMGNGLIKLALVAILSAYFGVYGIIASWTVALIVLVLVGLVFFFPRLQPGYRPVPALPQAADKEILRFAFGTYLSAGFGSLPGWILPVLVLNIAGSQSNAYFYMGWAFANFLFAIPSAAANSLFAESSRHQKDLYVNIKKSVRFILMLALPAALILALAGGKLLLVFGREYSEQSTRLLWLLIPSILPMSVNALYGALAKVQKKIRTVIWISAANASGTLILAYALLPRMGILAPGLAWLVSQTAVAMFLLPRLIAMIREGNTVGSVD